MTEAQKFSKKFNCPSQTLNQIKKWYNWNQHTISEIQYLLKLRGIKIKYSTLKYWIKKVPIIKK